MRTGIVGLAIVWSLAAAVTPAVADSGPDTAPQFTDLPPPAVAVRVILENPQVRAARSGLEAAAAERARVSAGPHEFTVHAIGQRRHVAAPTNERFREWEVGLERALRTSKKATLDNALGETVEARAHFAYGDAIHEGARNLLRLWFGLLRERVQENEWRNQLDLLRLQAAMTDKRVRAGESPRMDALAAAGALAQAEAGYRQARARVVAAETALRTQFPGLEIPADVNLGVPTPVTGDIEYWRDAILGDNHELQLVEAESRQWRLTFARADADRIPDPSIGLQLGSDRGGDERIVGIRVSVPLPGTARKAIAAEQRAKAEASTWREAAVRAKLEGEVGAAFNSAQGAYESWLHASRAEEAVSQTVELTQRAYQIGEVSLSETLLARKQLFEARQASALARVDARETYARLLLEAHRLWPLEEAADSPGS